MSTPDDDSDLEAYLRTFRLVHAPGVDTSLDQARRLWGRPCRRANRTWLLPVAAAAMLLLDMGITRLLGRAFMDDLHQNDVSISPVSQGDTAIPSITLVPKTGATSLSLSMLELRPDIAP